MTEQKGVAMMTKDQLERAALIAESRHIDLATAQELVLKELIRDLTIAINSCRDVTTLGRFAASVDPVGWVRELQAHLETVTESARSLLPVQPAQCGCEGSCPVCRVGEVDNHYCRSCGSQFCSKCHGLLYTESENVGQCSCNPPVQPAASTPTDLSAEMETVDSLLAKVSEERVQSDYPTYGEINECRKAIRRIVAATAASTEPVYGSGREFMLNSRFNDPVVSTEAQDERD